MSTRIGLHAVLLLMSWAAYAEEKNPFPEAQLNAEEKILDPTPTQAEKDAIAKFDRARRDGKPAEDGVYQAAKEAIEHRLTAAPTKWSDDDFKTRLRIITELSAKGVNLGSNLGSVHTAIRTFVAARDDDPTGLVRRMQLLSAWHSAGGIRIKWRQIVSQFLENDKYKKATPKQRLDFVHDWLQPRLPKDERCTHDVEELVLDLKADAGITDAKPAHK